MNANNTYLSRCLCWQQQAAARRMRLVLCLHGPQPQVQQAAARLWQARHHTPLSVHEHTPVLARALLGQDWDAVYCDLASDWDADVLAILAGGLRAGGICVFACPEAENSTLAPFSARLLRRLQAASGLAHVTLQRDRYRPPHWPHAGTALQPDTASGCITHDQQQAWRRALRGLRQRHWIGLLLADRGRGKSALLGLLAARHQQDKAARCMLLTAPARACVQPVWQHVAEGVVGQPGLAFMAPDALLASEQRPDVLLIDEAAALPLPMVLALVQRSRRVVLSSTLHGYEGSGRGFALRCAQALRAAGQQPEQLVLHQAVRWADGDPLETLLQDGLLLDAVPEPVRWQDGMPIRAEPLPIAHWLADEQRLRHGFGLLLQAHYRTQPGDVQRFVNAAHWRLWQGQQNGVLQGLLLARCEDALSPALAAAVFRGQRRLPGQLLSQTLASCLDDAALAGLRCLRISRIVVHGACQRHGLGSVMLDRVAHDARIEGFAWLGASFGLTADLLAFWQRAGFVVVRVGWQRQARSGCHNVVLVRALTAHAETALSAMRRRFMQQLPHQLMEMLAGLEPALVLALLQGSEEDGKPDFQQQEIAAFALGQRSYENSQYALWHWALQQARADRLAALPEVGQALLVGKLLQRRSWVDCVGMSGLKGRRQALASLRVLVAGIIL